MLGAIAAAAAICGLSLLAGRAVLLLCGTGERTWLAGPVGLAVLLVVCSVAVDAPGHGATALGALLALAIGSVAVLRRTPSDPVGAGGRREWVTGAATGLLVALAGLLPYALNGLFGPLGPGLNDDLGFHYAWAEALDTDAGADPLIDPFTPGYPLGPHALVAALAEVTGGVPEAFAGLLLAIPVLTALTALAALREGPLAGRVAAAALTGLTYLGASYYAQAMFKELLLALFALAFALLLGSGTPGSDPISRMGSDPISRTGSDPKRANGVRPRVLRSLLAGAPLGLLAAGALLAFSYPGMAVLAAVAAGWVAAEAVLARERWRARVAAVLPALAGAAVVALVALVAEAGRIFDVSGGLGAGAGGGDIYPGGNFVGDVSARLVFGTWLSRDFRFPSEHRFVTEFGVVLAAALALYAVRWWVRHRDVTVPVALSVVLAGYLWRRGAEVPYYTTKLLVVAAPLVTLLIARAVLGGRRIVLAAGALLAVIMAGAGAFALRGAPVGDLDQTRDLATLRAAVGDAPVLFLPIDHFLRTALGDATISSREPYGFTNAIGFRTKPGYDEEWGRPLEAIDVVPRDLARFRFVITARAGAPPPGFRLARTTNRYALWERGGSAPRIEPSVFGPDGWRLADGRPPARDGLGHAILAPGEELRMTIDPPLGEALLSLEYKTPVPLDVMAGPLRVTLDREFDPPADRWPVGVVTGGRPVTVAVRAEDDRPWRLEPLGTVGALALTPPAAR